MKLPKILFFIAGMAPTIEESEAALDIGMVAMRNRSLIGPHDNPEACDAVAGEVIPPPYARFPVVKTLAQAVAIVRDKQKAENAKQVAFLAQGAPAAATSVGNPAAGKGTPSPDAGLGGKPPAKPAATGWKANA